jgi:hypothetical protein
MNTLKKELKVLIDLEDDIDRLEQVKIILTGRHPDPVGREFTPQSSFKTRENIKSRGVLSGGEAFARKDPSKMKG